MTTIDSLERQVRRGTALAWLVPTLMALDGARRGRQASGRKAGRPYTELPWWLYSLGGSVYLVLCVLLWRPLPVMLSRPARATAALGGGLLSALGLGLVLWGRLALGEMYSVSSAAGVQLFARHQLITSGPFTLVRHPMYLGALVAGLGALLLYRTWTVLFILAHCGVFVVRARREEQALAAEFGPRWEVYRRRVPGWIPRLPWPAVQRPPGP